jgi:hypothetical protein
MSKRKEARTLKGLNVRRLTTLNPFRVLVPIAFISTGYTGGYKD